MNRLQFIRWNLIFIVSGFLLKNSLPVAATTYYVAPDGSDNYKGTIASPWGTWQKAFSTAVAGDIVYFRGGTYYSAGTSTWPKIDPHGYVPLGHSGTPTQPICFYNYPGETPILDCSEQFSISSIISGIEIIKAHDIKFKGLTICNVFQREQAKLAQGITLSFTSNLSFENMTVHDISGRGMYASIIVGYYDGNLTPDTIKSDTTRWINCDFYNLCDSLSASPGDAADGMKGIFNGRTSVSYPNSYWYLYGCRFWNYTDDGADLGGHGIVVLDHCWASSTHKYWNYCHASGWDMEGNGFKEGGRFVQFVMSDSSAPINWRIIKNCVAANCVGAGFYDLDYIPYYRTNALIYNNTSYNNKIGFYGLENYSYRPRTTILRNNIAYKNSDYPAAFYRPSIYPESNNTWAATQQVNDWPGWVTNPNVTVTDNDFISLDTTQIYSARKSDHSLPDITFLHLAKVSDLIDAGIDVGLPISGKSPYMGAFEYTIPLPVVLNNQVFNVKEENYPADSIGKVIATPGDYTQTLIYQIISGNDSGFFAIDTLTGNLTIINKRIFDYASLEYNLTIQVQVVGETTVSSSAIVTVNLEKSNTINSLLQSEIREPSFKVYPNPTNGIFNVAYKDICQGSAKLTIFDNTGKIIYEENYAPTISEFSQQYDLSNVSSGIYFVILKTGDKIYCQHLVIHSH